MWKWIFTGAGVITWGRPRLSGTSASWRNAISTSEPQSGFVGKRSMASSGSRPNLTAIHGIPLSEARNENASRPPARTRAFPSPDRRTVLVICLKSVNIFSEISHNLREIRLRQIEATACNFPQLSHSQSIAKHEINSAHNVRLSSHSSSILGGNSESLLVGRIKTTRGTQRAAASN